MKRVIISTMCVTLVALSIFLCLTLLLNKNTEGVKEDTLKDMTYETDIKNITFQFASLEDVNTFDDLRSEEIDENDIYVYTRDTNFDIWLTTVNNGEKVKDLEKQLAYRSKDYMYGYRFAYPDGTVMDIPERFAKYTRFYKNSQADVKPLDIKKKVEFADVTVKLPKNTRYIIGTEQRTKTACEYTLYKVDKNGIPLQDASKYLVVGIATEYLFDTKSELPKWKGKCNYSKEKNFSTYNWYADKIHVEVIGKNASKVRVRHGS